MWQIFWLSIFCIIEIISGFCENELGCTFNGEVYPPFSEVQFGCFEFQCLNDIMVDVNGRFFWVFTNIDSSCPRCDVCNDPHFLTFDGHNYDFHKVCNYTISQPIGCCDYPSSYFPPYGIFGDFQVCDSGAPYPKCLDVTTYKISDDLWVDIKFVYPTPTLEINGEPLTVSPNPISYYDCSSSSSSSVIIWQKGECIYIVGTYYSIVACYHCIHIYTVVEHMNNIGGLCGFYSGNKTDEFRLRNCSSIGVAGNENPFGENWKTIDQRDKECRGCSNFNIPPEVPICENEGEAQSLCKEVITQVNKSCPFGYTDSDVSRVIEDCVEDCCLTGFKNCEKWAKAGFEYLCTLYQLASDTYREGEGRK